MAAAGKRDNTASPPSATTSSIDVTTAPLERYTASTAGPSSSSKLAPPSSRSNSGVDAAIEILSTLDAVAHAAEVSKNLLVLPPDGKQTHPYAQLPTDLEYLAAPSTNLSFDEPNMNHFRFPDLPAELRIEILTLVARTRGRALLKHDSRGVLSTADPISLVSKQVREEYLGVLYQHAETTIAYVLNFDFRHIVTYYNKLNAAEQRALPKKQASAAHPVPLPNNHRRTVRYVAASRSMMVPRKKHLRPFVPLPPRTFKILLDFTPTCKWQSTHLLRWINRRESKDKIGADAGVKYCSYSEEIAEWRYRAQWHLEVRKLPSLTEAQKKEVANIAAATRLPSTLSGLTLPGYRRFCSSP